MCEQLLDFHFSNRLNDAGYESCKAFYRFNFNQGDNVVFFGRPDLTKLADRLMMGSEKAGVKRAIAKEAKLVVGRHSHAPDVITVQRTNWGSGLTDYEIEMFAAFMEAVAEDAKALCQELLAEGYCLISAGYIEDNEEVLRSFSTRRFTVTLTKVRSEAFDIHFLHPGEGKVLVSDFLEGKRRFFDLKVTITAKEHGFVLGTAYQRDLTETIGVIDLSFGGCREELINEAVNQARSVLSALQAA